MITTGEIVLGFAAAAILGVLLAMLVVYVKPFETAFYPWIVATQAVPKVAMGPLFIYWLGFGLVPKIVIAFLIAFFPVFIDVLVGLRSVDPDAVKLMRSMGASGWQSFRYLRLPQALPSVFAGLKVGITFASVGAVVGEFIGADEGLGYLLLYANASLDTPLLFVALLLVSIVSLLLYAALTAVERVCIRWHVSVRTSSNTATF
jgi:NitT/TauT family transport system permease protein